MTGVRMRVWCILLLGPLASSCAHDGRTDGADPQPLSRIAFGSCADEDDPQPIWDAVLAADPQLMLLLGDNVYGDTLDMDVLLAKYAKFGAVPGFAKLRRSCEVMATWDDHDYGTNDAGAEHPMKAQSQRVFLDFFDTPENSPRRKREGIYTARVFGPPGRRVQVVVLDTRYFRSPLRASAIRVQGRGPHEPNTDPDSTVLGETQWRWLEQQLRKPAEVRLIASSVQVVATGHGFETWGNFPRERQRLFDLVRDTKARGVIFLSGDRHHAELSVERKSGVGYPLYDFTSSGLNRTRPPGVIIEPNTLRVGEVCLANNFGLITIDWTGRDPRIEMHARGVDGSVSQAWRAIRLSELR